MELVNHEFELAADAWDWLDEHGYLMKMDQISTVAGREMHLIDFAKADGSIARLYLSPCELDGAEVRLL